MKTVLSRFPIRCVLLAVTLIGLTVVMWNAWPFGTGIALAFMFQAVSLARAMGFEPANDPATSQNRNAR